MKCNEVYFKCLNDNQFQSIKNYALDCYILVAYLMHNLLLLDFKINFM